VVDEAKSYAYFNTTYLVSTGTVVRDYVVCNVTCTLEAEYRYTFKVLSLLGRLFIDACTPTATTEEISGFD